jgi:hypothetical protein
VTRVGSAQLTGTGASDDAKPYTQDQIATLLGFHGAMNVSYLTKIWRLFKLARVPNYDYLHCTIKGEMLRWADGHRCWIEEGVYFDNKTLGKWIALKFNPGDSTALYSSSDKGISILKCRAPTSAHLEDLRQQEEVWDATKGNTTYVEVIKQSKSKDVCHPPHDFGELRSNISTFCALLFTLFGEGCDLYRTMLSILQILSHPFSMQNKQAYTPEVVCRILWAIIVDTRSYFDDINLAEDFLDQGQYLQFPVSTLKWDLIAIKHGIKIQHHNFPAEWTVPDPYQGPTAEWNFSYVLPQSPGNPCLLVVPTSLQMGWVESPPFFYAASETAPDVVQDYCETELGTLPPHKFTHNVIGNHAYEELPETDPTGQPFRYLLKVYVDDFVSLVIPTSWDQLRHVSTGTMTGIHDVFPADNNNSNDPISEKKLKQLDGEYATTKTILGFEFDGLAKTLWLEDAKRAHLLTVLHGWLRSSRTGMLGILFKEFESVIAKIRHTFTAIPAGRGLLTPCNKMLQMKPPMVYLHRNAVLLAAVAGCRTLLRESSDSPTQCRKLVSGWLDYIRVCDASSHGVGGVVFGETEACLPTVFRWEWSPDVKEAYHSGRITNSDLEMACLLFLWLVIESVCGDLREKHVALFSNNSPTVGWVRRLATRGSLVLAHLIRALALRLKLNSTCPITPLHIAGEDNSMTDIPLRSFGSEPQWFCRTNNDLLTLFNTTFPLPNQSSWNVFQLSYALSTRMTSVLPMKDFTLEEWR